MNLPTYSLLADKSYLVFEFVSIGPKGHIPKVIILGSTALYGFYNLAFGDKNLATGALMDDVVTNNGDSELVLATVVKAVYAFTDRNPEAWIYAKGSSQSRTRLYQMGISKFLEVFSLDFDIYGLRDGEWEKSTKDRLFNAFIAKRKKLPLKSNDKDHEKNRARF